MESYERKARNARLRLIGIGVAAAAVLGGAGFLVASALGGHSASHPAAAASSPAAPSGAVGPMTPAKGHKVHLVKPAGQKDGSSIGFPHSTFGAISAAVYHMEEYAFLDDIQARRQLEVTTANDSPDSIDQAVSDVRKLRETVGLPPSGGTPAGLNISTDVDAVRITSITTDGNVVEVWMHYSRYATLPNSQVDDNPLKDQTSDVILEWQDGDWKITTKPEYEKKRTFPVAYDPNSSIAWQDGWWQVIREDN